MLERAPWGRVGKVTEEGRGGWGSPRLRLKLFLMGVKLGQRLREQDGGRVAQLPFLTYLSHGGGAHQPLPPPRLTPQPLPPRRRLPLGEGHTHTASYLLPCLLSFTSSSG